MKKIKTNKMKTNKGTAKRFKITKTGKVMHRRGGHSHLLAKKSSKRKRFLKHRSVVPKSQSAIIKKLLPYG